LVNAMWMNTMIYETVGENEFVSAFQSSAYKENFSYEALCMLFNYYEDFEEDIELDVVAIACDWSELTIDEIIREYNFEEDLTMEELMDYLSNRTSAIQLTDSIVFQVF
jgi:hypothetical protein